MQLAELIKILAEDYPLASNQEELRYSDEYTALEAEQQKLNSLHGEKPDYLIIIQNSVALIKQGASHFTILTALAHAMLQQYKWQGFIEGLNFMSSRLSTQWESLYPSVDRMKGRIQPMTWLVERFVRYIEVNPINGLGKDFLVHALDALKSLDETCQTYFADQINLMSLIRPFEDNKKRVSIEEDVRAVNQKMEEERRAKEAESALHQTLDENAEVVSTDEYLANLETVELHVLASKRLMSEQLELLKDNPLEFAIYKHNRSEMWWRYPTSSQELVLAIDEQGLNWEAYTEALKLKTLQHYNEALIAFEALAHESPYFLDLQFHICDCLEELKAEEPLLAMLKNECRELCARYPELITAKINNEFALCSKQTKAYFGVLETKPL